MWIAVVIALMAIYFIVDVLVSRSRTHKGPQPPQYPGALPLIGHGHLFASGNSVALFELCKDICSYSNSCGGVTGLKIGWTQNYLISDPDDCLTLSNASLEKNFIYEFMKPLLGNGMLIAPVPIWKVHRKLLSPAFNQEVLDGFIGIFNSQAKKLVNSLSQEVGKKPFNFWPYIGSLGLETICFTAMGGAADSVNSTEYLNAIEELADMLTQKLTKFWLHNSLIFYFSTIRKKQEKYIKIVNDVTYAVLEKKRNEMLNGTSNVGENSGRKFKAFIDLIMEYSGEKSVLSDQEIINETTNIILAGQDTSASTIVYALILLGSHPEIQERIFEEILEVLGDRDVEKQDLPKLVFLEAVLKETMRLYPIAPFVGRRLTEDVQLKNCTLPAGSSAFLAIHALHRLKMWGDDVEHFVPDRWLDKSRIPEHPAAFAAFSIGRRMCIDRPPPDLNLGYLHGRQPPDRSATTTLNVVCEFFLYY
ncbi:hypothetical protein MSG28_014231 [Choristoneura fumiferana]|uniref:Uncharacterized protein n=1 Tax=Choristoneura fumiferana TaxID=7141 RepID=A0ACC0JGI4_CHOFU|nr:hypothetical protein MSG28_014231 [Choristoneura fumiferana]